VRHAVCRREVAALDDVGEPARATAHAIGRAEDDAAIGERGAHRDELRLSRRLELRLALPHPLDRVREPRRIRLEQVVEQPARDVGRELGPEPALDRAVAPFAPCSTARSPELAHPFAIVRHKVPPSAEAGLKAAWLSQAAIEESEVSPRYLRAQDSTCSCAGGRTRSASLARARVRACARTVGTPLRRRVVELEIVGRRAGITAALSWRRPTVRSPSRSSRELAGG